MFDLFKDIEKYKGVPPYASELYGEYQPLLGWRSQLTLMWLGRSADPINSRIRHILNANIVPGPTGNNDIGYVHGATKAGNQNIGKILPGTFKSGYTVHLSRQFGSELLNILRVKVQQFVDDHKGKLPINDEWKGLISAENYVDQENGDLRLARVAVLKRFGIQDNDAPKLTDLEMEHNYLPFLANQLSTVRDQLLMFITQSPGLGDTVVVPGKLQPGLGDKFPGFDGGHVPPDGIKPAKYRSNNLGEHSGEEKPFIDITGGGSGKPTVVPPSLDSDYKRALEIEKALQYETQIAAFLLRLSESESEIDLKVLQRLFVVQQTPSVEDILTPEDPLAHIDPQDKTLTLSPVGFIHMFRQYFFDLGSFLGEPIEHIWLAPGTTTELIEVSTRKTILERQEESSLETASRSELSASLKDELSDAVREENQNSTKLGVSSTQTANFYVYQGTVSANFGTETTLRQSRESVHKQNREQSEKHSTEIKRSFKSIFKTVTETTDFRSRRYVLQNNGEKLLNYELRRKMRRVGVQVQDIGTRLCWQVFVDDPGRTLGLSELIHFAGSPDLSNLKEPDKVPEPGPIKKRLPIRLEYKPTLGYNNNRATYVNVGHFDGNPNKQLRGLIQGDSGDDDSEIVIEFKNIKIAPPQTGYILSDDIRPVGVQGNKLAVVSEILGPTKTKEPGRVDITMERVNFGGENFINLELECTFTPTQPEKERVAMLNIEAGKKYDAEKARVLLESYQTRVRERIKAASGIRSRPAWDLREEERTIVYRELIRRLMLDSWGLPDDEVNRRLSHVRAEIVRSLFDVDSMLYFVAPEWWMPQRRRGTLNLDFQVGDKEFNVTENDVVSWGGEIRSSNYRITEEAAPARLGSSLGWLLQLDGDNLRNAFLNAPWVKAVIPIRPGREVAALKWLKSTEGEDGWSADYLGTEPEFQGQEIGKVIDNIAAKLEKENGDIKNVLQADKVFENGFDHLKDGFNAGLDPNQVYSQWVSVLPTDQVVAVEYEPTDLMSSIPSAT